MSSSEGSNESSNVRSKESSSMTEIEFNTLAEQTLDAIEAAIEAAMDASAGAADQAANDSFDIDVEIERSGNVLTLELPNGSKVIINSQTPMQQIWVAARSGGFHYALQDGQWRDTRDGSELYAALSRMLSQQGGHALVLRPG
jgi:CyaY protein